MIDFALDSGCNFVEAFLPFETRGWSWLTLATTIVLTVETKTFLIEQSGPLGHLEANRGKEP
jgi:hypothetical protein